MVVCGDGACGKFIRCIVWGYVLHLRRQNIITQRFHAGIFHTSLVRLLHDLRCFYSPKPYLSEPTVFENYVQDLYIDDQLVELSLWDTAGASLSPNAFGKRLTCISQDKKNSIVYGH